MVVNFAEADKIFINVVAKSRDNWLFSTGLVDCSCPSAYRNCREGSGVCSMFLVIFPKSPKPAGSTKRSR